MVYVSGSLMSVTPLTNVITNNFTVMIISGFTFGLAYGGYITCVLAI